MADKKISALNSASVPLDGTEILPVVQSGTTVKVAVSDLTAGRAVGASAQTLTAVNSAPLHFVATTTAQTEGADTGYVDFYQSDTSGSGAGIGTTAKISAVSSRWYNSGTYQGYFGTAARLGFFVNTGQANTSLTEALSIVNSGLIGVNNTTPTQAVDVVGNIKTSGNLVVGTSGNGIDFSATGQAGGMTSELLNDYEEGTWTPGQGAGLTVVGAFSSAGKYTKVGRLVTLTGYIAGATSVAFAANAVIVTGLPYTADTANGKPVGIGANAANSALSGVEASNTSLNGVVALAATTRFDFTITYTV